MVNNQIKFLQIEPTTRCNFNCKFCCGREMPQNDMDLEDFTKIVSSIQNLEHIQLQGEGEPFLNKEIFKMIDIIYKYHPNVKISMTSNGSLLTDTVISNLIDRKIHSILISIESPDSTGFKYLRGGDLNIVLDNLRNFMKKKIERKAVFPKVGLAVTVLKDTVKDISKIKEIYRELHLDGEFTIQFLQEMKEYSKVYDEYMMTQFLNSDEKKSIFEEMSSDDIGSFSDGFFDGLYSFNGKGCCWLENGLYVSCDGYTHCCSYNKSEKNSLGNIKQQSIEEIIKRRSALQSQLINEETPTCCRNCPDIQNNTELS